MKTEITGADVLKHLDKFTDIYDEGKVVPFPKNTPLVVYCNNGEGHVGWVEVQDEEDLGLEALIAQSFIERTELLKLINS